MANYEEFELPHAFTDHHQPLLDWNWVNTLIVPVDLPDNRNPVPLEIPEGDQWRIRTTFTPEETGQLKDYIADNAEAMVRESAWHAPAEGITDAEDMQLTSEFLLKTVGWLTIAEANDREVEVIPIPEDSYPPDNFITR